MTKKKLLITILASCILLPFLRFTVKAQELPAANTQLENSAVVLPLRIKAQQVLASHDDLYYSGGWEKRENEVYTVIYFNTRFSVSGYTYQDVTSAADRNAGMMRIRTYYHYIIN
ncbi:hypothetical protein SDC9_111142 [bioreactor metagenome]|uniref:Uncharacterized protein n=1 Tax=bioreactor metagenome TaxID=1076179 RepID=A0A645BGH5_9ZZZZ|nr:hypothetical protein [Erysipelotrichaceae bacterium]